MHRYVPASGERASWPLPERIGCIARRGEGGFIAGFKSGFAFLDLPEGRIGKIGDPEPERPNDRMNDGKCDAEGRFWAAQAGGGRVDHALEPIQFTPVHILQRRNSFGIPCC